MKKEKDGKTSFKKKGRPNLVSDDFIKKIKTIMIVTPAAATAISRRIVMAIGNGVVGSNSVTLSKENRGSLARGVIESVNQTQRKDTTGKIEPSKQLLLEEKLTFQKKISGVIFEHDISKELIINLDQTPLSYVSPGKYTFDVKGVKTVPIKGIDDKRQITATFAISMSGEFLPIQVIYMRAKLKDIYLSILFQPVLMSRFLKTTGLTLKSLPAFLTRSFFLISKTFEKPKVTQMSR